MGIGAKGGMGIVLGTSAGNRAAATVAAVAGATTEVLLSEGRKPLLLGDGVDVRSNDEGD